MVVEAEKQTRTGQFNDLREYLAALDAAGLLRRIKTEVDLKHEIGAICARSMKRGGPALMFENIRGYPGMPLVTNLLSSTALLAVVFGTDDDPEQIYEKIVHG